MLSLVNQHNYINNSIKTRIVKDFPKKMNPHSLLQLPLFIKGRQMSGQQDIKHTQAEKLVSGLNIYNA